MRWGWRAWISTMATNAAIALLVVGAMWLVGVKPFLMVHLPITLLASSIGVWLFYVQHQFEETHWAKDRAWSKHEAALHGSSHYDLPLILRWFTANIGVHHVHHLSSRIPYYRLSRVLRDHPELKDIGRLTLLESLGCVRLVLWDETLPAPDFICGVSPVVPPWPQGGSRLQARASSLPRNQFQPQMVLTASGGTIRGRLFLCRHQFRGLGLIAGRLRPLIQQPG